MLMYIFKYVKQNLFIPIYENYANEYEIFAQLKFMWRSKERKKLKKL